MRLHLSRIKTTVFFTMRNTFAKTLCFILFLAWTACQKQEAAIISVNPKGEITAFGKPVSDLEALKSALVDSLSKMSVIPEKLSIHFEGEVGMGTRQEVETLATEAVAAAKIAQKAPKIDIVAFRKTQGDCDKADSLRTFCANIDLQYPTVVKGEKPLQDSVAKWTNMFLFSVLESEEKVTSTSLEEAAAAFFKNHNESKGSVMAAGFDATTGSEIVYNDGKYLTLAINAHTYQGGAHGNHLEAINTFDAQTGRILTWDDLVTDKAAVLALAEKKLRAERADVFQEGFDFDDTFKLILPAAYGLTKEGLFLYYVPYEIMPYAMGASEVMIPYEELGEKAKIRL
jgi:hypothetical protein